MKRRITLFLAKQLLLFGVFYLALDLYSDFRIDGRTSGNVEIKIHRGDIKSGILRLTPSGKVPVYAGKNVTWSVKSSPNVESFEIQPKGSSVDVFEGGPPRGNRENDGEGKLKDRNTEVEYDYKIIWYDRDDGGPYVHDPKIAVKPSTNRFLEVLIYATYAASAALIAFLAFRRR